MSEVHRWEAVHIKDGDSNIRYQDDTGPDMVKASDYDQLKEENERIKEEIRRWVIRLQQRGLEMDELSNECYQLTAERDTLRKQLDEARELLNDSRNKINYMMQNGERYQPQFLLERIDDWMEVNNI